MVYYPFPYINHKDSPVSYSLVPKAKVIAACRTYLDTRKKEIESRIDELVAVEMSIPEKKFPWNLFSTKAAKTREEALERLNQPPRYALYSPIGWIKAKYRKSMTEAGELLAIAQASSADSIYLSTDHSWILPRPKEIRAVPTQAFTLSASGSRTTWFRWGSNG